MNVTELARRLRVTPQELLAKLPELGFDIGGRAIKVDDRVADQIYKKWIEHSRLERMRLQLVRPGVQAVAGGPKLEVELPSVVSVRDFAGKLNLPVTRVMQQLLKAGILAAQNERIDYTTAAIIAEELGYEAKPEAAKKQGDVSMEILEANDRLKTLMDLEKPEDLLPRAPVVVVMGHVDHGKTSTLDAIRKTNVVARESGGITQHIGAYQVEKKDRKITFIDTPGHEAFTVMRSRGAKVADIAILVVAADDGVQPQTKEAYSIIQAAKLPFVVALNKIDKADADPNRVMGQLAEIGVNVEEWGGKIPMARISAKTGQGIDELLDVVLLVADMEKDRIMANPNRLAAGTIIEAHVDKGEGPVATALVQTGTLRRNDWLGIGGASYGRVRMMRDWTGKALEVATPGTPVKILGFKVTPAVGDIMEVPADPKLLEQKMKTSRQVSESFTATKAIPTESEEATKKKTLNIILKTDVLGSLEAILGMLEKISHELVAVNVIQKGLGNITDADVERAANSQPSVVYGFGVLLPTQVEAMSRDKNVEIKMVKVIYDLFDDVVAKLNALLPQELIVTELGQAEIAAVFLTEPGKMILGAKVKEGKLTTGCKVRVYRMGAAGEMEVVGEGVLETLQAGKSPVKEVSAGKECGMSFRGKVKVLIGDRFDAYSEESKTRKVESFR